MKKTFKRFLSSALAAVMAASVLSVGMVTSASAEEKGFGTIEITKTTTTWDFSSNIPNSSESLANNDTLHGIIVTNGSGKATLKGSEKNLSFQNDDAIAVPVPKDSVGTATLISKSSDSTRHATLNGVKKDQTKDDGAIYDFNATETNDGFLNFSFSTDSSGKEYKFQKLIVTLTSGEFEVPTTYKLTGKCTGLSKGDSFVLKKDDVSYTVTVGEEGAYSYSTQTATITAGSYDVVLKDYAIEPNKVNITAKANSETEFEISETINFTKLTLEEIASGTYKPADIEAGLPNFDTSDLTVAGTESYRGTLKFKLSSDAVVTINGKCGSSTSGRSVTVKLGDLSKTASAGGSDEDFVANVPAGDATLTLDSTNTGLKINTLKIEYVGEAKEGLEKLKDGETAIYNDTDNKVSYLIVGVTADDAANSDQLILTVGKNNTTSTTEVYESFKDGGVTVTADDIGAKYLFAVKVTGVEGTDSINNLKTTLTRALS